MAGSLLPQVLVQQLDSYAEVVDGAAFYFYLTGTTTAAAVYADSDLATSLGAVIEADTAGRMPNIYLDETVTYKLVIKSATDGSTIRSIDPLNKPLTGGVIDVTRAPYFARPGLGDQTAAFTAAGIAAVAAGKPLYVPGGSSAYTVNFWQPPSGLHLYGDGHDLSVLKRPAGALTNAPIVYFYQKHGIRIRGVGFHGNNSNNSVLAHNLLFVECWDVDVSEVASRYAKGSAGSYGGGIVVVDGADYTNGTTTTIRNSTSSLNDVYGVLVQRARRVSILDNTLCSNGSSGAFVGNYVFPPSYDVQSAIIIARNQCHNNGTTGNGAGITLLGNIVGGSAGAPEYSPLPVHSRQVIITENTCSFNASYGVAVQGGFVAVLGNTCYRNGLTVNDGNILFNAYGSTLSGNTSEDASFFGIDAGGSWWCVISNNIVNRTGVSTGLGGIDINVGATVGTSVLGNNIVQGGTLQTTGISATGYDSDGTSAYDWIGQKLKVADNIIYVNSNANSCGIHITAAFDFASVTNNDVHNAPAGKAFILSILNVKQTGNCDYTALAATSVSGIVASASSLIIPDVGETFYVSGTTGITNIYTQSMSDWLGECRAFTMTNIGSGYDPLNPPSTANGGIVISGGTGTGVVCTGLVSNQGHFLGAYFTNNGSGFNGTETVAIAAPVSGTTATATLQIGCGNQEGRLISLLFQGALTVTDGGNLALVGNLNTTANQTILRLRGAYGRWFEEGRSTV